jgi:hypothetical protein
LFMARRSKSTTISGKAAQCSRVHGESGISVWLNYRPALDVESWSINTSKNLTGDSMFTPHSSTAIINFEASPRVSFEGEGYESFVVSSTELIVLRASVSMIMLAKPTKTATMIAKESNPPVTDLYSISLSKRSN